MLHPLIATDKGGKRSGVTPCTKTPQDLGDCHGKSDRVLHTEELSETVEDSGSAATRKNHRVLPTDEAIRLAAIHLGGLRGNMTYIPTQTGFMRLEDSENCCGPSSQTIPAWNRGIPRHVWNRK